jgi:hypothetical protein
VKTILSPMAIKGEEPIGSMGTDTPLACLSDKPQPLFHYFKQLFAQVTNPPIDPIREELVMSLTSYIGTERNILEETPEHCHTLKLERRLTFSERSLPVYKFAMKGNSELQSAFETVSSLNPKVEGFVSAVTLVKAELAKIALVKDSMVTIESVRFIEINDPTKDPQKTAKEVSVYGSYQISLKDLYSLMEVKVNWLVKPERGRTATEKTEFSISDMLE